MKLTLSDPVAWDVELHDSWLATENGKTISQHTGLASASGTCEQDLSQHTVTIAVISSRQPQTATQNYAAICSPCIDHLDIKHRKPDKRHRLRNMLIPQNGETVIGRHEEIVAGDVGRPVERRLVRFNYRRKPVPFLLDAVRNRLPAIQSPAMNLQSLHLCRRTTERMTVPGPPIADPITMIERDIAGGTPAIRETSIWMINRHKANGLKKTGCPHRRRRLEARGHLHHRGGSEGLPMCKDSE